MTGQQQDWDIVSSVGMTALATTAARAIATASTDPVIVDPYAAEFVHAANPPQPLPTKPVDDTFWMAIADYVALRARFFDEVLTSTDLPQVVILAAGLDARAYRLDLTGRDVYEIEQPRVLGFKQDVLDARGAQPRCRRHAVGVDLRDDWAAALEAAGFDRTRPTVWIAEGLLPYLPAEAEERLFDLLHPRCAPGSRIAFEHIPAANVAELAETFRTTEAGKQVGMDTNQLLSLEPRRDPGEWLAGQGWQVRSERAADLVHRFGASAPGEHASKLAKGAIVTADLPK